MWTHEERLVLQELKKQCLYGLFLHSRSAYINHWINNALVFPNIVLGGILSVSIFTTSNGSWRLAGGAIALMSTVLTGFTKHVGAAEKSQLHCLVVREYQRLLQDINVFIYTNIENTDGTIQMLRKDMDKIIGIQPDPSMWVMQRFDKVYRERFEDMMFKDFEKTMVQEAATVNNRVSNQRFKHSGSITPHQLYAYTRAKTAKSDIVQGTPNKDDTV